MRNISPIEITSDVIKLPKKRAHIVFICLHMISVFVLLLCQVDGNLCSRNVLDTLYYNGIDVFFSFDISLSLSLANKNELREGIKQRKTFVFMFALFDRRVQSYWLKRCWTISAKK